MTETPVITGLSIRPRNGSRQLVISGGSITPVECTIDENGTVTNLQTPPPTDAKSRSTVTTQGLIDIQVNGFAGVDFNQTGLTAGEMDHALGHLAASGVSCVLPTLITAPEDELVNRLCALDRAVSQSILGPLMVSGYHIEGPFLSPKEGSAGAHPAKAMRPGSKALIARLQSVSSRPLLILTVAPEQEGVLDLIPFLIEQGVACAIGHTAASRSEISAAVAAGATLSTHLGNGLPHVLNKSENPLICQLSHDELTASFIADGIHIHPRNLQTYFRAKTLARSIVVTDAVAAAGKNMPPGLYGIGDTQNELHKDGTVRIPGSTYLAGSSVTMDQTVRNLMNWYDYSIEDVLLLARENPRRIVGNFAGDLAVGSHANLVRWHYQDGGLNVRETSIGPWVIGPVN